MLGFLRDEFGVLLFAFPLIEPWIKMLGSMGKRQICKLLRFCPLSSVPVFFSWAMARYLAILLSIWFLFSYAAGILFVDQLNTIRMGGFKLGFWFAQQGSIYAFVIIIFVYVWLMNKLDKEFDVDEIDEKE